MKFSKSKWLAYTFLVGLIPVLTRFFTWVTTAAGAVSPLAAPDFVAFGLVLHISVINELEHLPAKERDWKTIQNGTSLLFITLYSALYAVTIIGEKTSNLIDANAMLKSCMIFALVSALLSLSVFHRLSKLYSR
jgi:membrane-associated PAP2 superfamily phosphatase